MKIEKKIVKGSPKLSLAAKSAIAASFGIAAITFTACEESGDPAAPEMPDLEAPDTEGPETENPSSSSKVLDIPLSHEALSSEAQDALSSAAQDALSSATENNLSSDSFEQPFPPPEAGVIPPDEDIYGPKSSSSEVTPPNSSSDEEIIEPLAGDPIIEVDSLSSSSTDIEQPKSSSSANSSSSFNHYQGECPNGPASPDCNIHFCEDPDSPCNLIVSMVTTYEPGDIRA